MPETRVQSLGRRDPLEYEMVTHSSIFAWRIPWIEEPSGLQSMGSQRVSHDWAPEQQQIHCTEKLNSHHGVLGSIPGLGRSLGEGNGNPLQYFCLENPHGEKSLVGYSPWGCKETDMSEQLTMLGHSSEPVALNGMNTSSYWDVGKTCSLARSSRVPFSWEFMSTHLSVLDSKFHFVLSFPGRYTATKADSPAEVKKRLFRHDGQYHIINNCRSLKQEWW